ncbi:MAG: hypothetical protein IJD09_02775 [Clostridia bacterium]|nr:hypothetical protein [Clostridia bacterium]
MMRKIIAVLILIVCLLSLGGCNTFEDTPETDAAFAAYEAALRQTLDTTAGAVSVKSINTDTLHDKESVGIIEYSFTTNADRRVTFERNDYTNGELVASYYGDGNKAYQMDLITDEWIDVTEDSVGMLVHDTNYFNTLSLFRIDNNFNYSKRYYQSVVMTDGEDGGKVITFTLKSDVISDMFSYTDDKSMKREMTNQTRSYYVNEKGDLYQIVISSSQNVSIDDKKGILSGVITVLVDFK